MKLKECLELGQDCGLETMREAIRNVYIHSSSMFSYSEIQKELDELYAEAEELISKTKFTTDDKTHIILGYLDWIKLGYSNEEAEELSKLAEIYIASNEPTIEKLCNPTGYIVTAEELAEMLKKEN